MVLVIPPPTVNERTRSYLSGRFGDYYRRHEPSASLASGRPCAPPRSTDREWGYIPFTAGEGTRMVRHEAVLGTEHLGELLQRAKPRHVYHSTAWYDDPGANTMGAKGWRGADLVFDLDADHLPGIDPAQEDNPTMLAACRDETVELVAILEDDFGFEELTIVFSGNRGYHVHVRDDGVADLDRHARREVVEYVRGEGIAFDTLVSKELVAGGVGTTTRRSFQTDAGWGRRIAAEVTRYLSGLRAQPRDAVVEELSSLPDIGPSRAESVARTVESRWSAIERGEFDLHPDFVRFVRAFVDHRVAGSGPAIDEPVTTDVHRLIRLPGSLHGATGLVVQPIDRDQLESYDPLADAVAPVFEQVDITVDVHEPVEVAVGGDTRRFSPGTHEVPEYVGIFLMAGGNASKVRE